MLILGLLGMYFDAAIVFVKSQTDTFIKIGCGHTVTEVTLIIHHQAKPHHLLGHGLHECVLIFFLPFSDFNKLKLKLLSKGHSFCKQCLHDLPIMKPRFSLPNLSKLARADISYQFMKTRSSSPNLSKVARADISCQFMKTRSLCRTVYKMNGLQ